MTEAPQKPARTPRFLLIGVVLAAVLMLGSGALLFFSYRDDPKGAAATLLGTAIGGPFQLVDQNGNPFSEADLKGKWHLLFFGYTHCPDTCPTTLNEVALALDRLGKKRDQVGVVFITVDPVRDTPETLKSYVASFDAPIAALSGSAEQVAKAAKAFRVYSAKRPRSDRAYDMDHSAVIYVMDPQGRFTASFTPDSTAEMMAQRLEKLLS